MAGDPNSTSTRWLAFPQSLAWIRQDRPGATDEWAWEELQRELLKAACGASEGVPIDKFRYPWAGRMVDLIVLLQNNHLTFANIWWQHVECNFDWLKRDWSAPAPLEEPAHSASTGAEAEESPAEPAAAGPGPARGADEVRPEAPVLAVNAPAPTTTAMSPRRRRRQHRLQTARRRRPRPWSYLPSRWLSRNRHRSPNGLPQTTSWRR